VQLRSAKESVDAMLDALTNGILRPGAARGPRAKKAKTTKKTRKGKS
jgi:hypothetical protein